MDGRVSAYIRRHHLGLIAVFIALSGTAYSAATAPKNSVTSKSIKNGAVAHKDLAANSVDGSNVIDDSLGGADIDEASLSGVNAAQLGGSAPSAFLQNGAAAGGDLAGTYPNPTVSEGSLDGSLITGVDAAKLGGAAPSAFLQNGAAAGGDLAGTYPNPTLKPLENWHEVGAGGEPAFQNSWANLDATTNSSAAFYKDPFGVVHIKGTVKNGASGSTAFTLPVGYRPSKDSNFPAVSYGGAPFVLANILIDDTTGVVQPSVNSGLTTNGVTLDGIEFRP